MIILRRSEARATGFRERDGESFRPPSSLRKAAEDAEKSLT
jgi:hypothetical protein